MDFLLGQYNLFSTGEVGKESFETLLLTLNGSVLPLATK